MKDFRKLALTVLADLPLAFVLWLLFVGTFASHELLIGLLAIAIAAAGRVVIEIHYPLHFSPTTSELLSLWRLPWYLLTDTAEILFVAAKDLFRINRAQSLFRVADFDTGKKGNAHDTARRVLAVTYTSATPSSIVLGINAKGGKMLFHQIERSGIPKMTQSLGAQS